MLACGLGLNLTSEKGVMLKWVLNLNWLPLGPCIPVGWFKLKGSFFVSGPGRRSRCFTLTLLLLLNDYPCTSLG